MIEHNVSAVFASTARSSRPVHKRVHMDAVQLNDHVNVINVKTARCNVSGHENIPRSRPSELFKGSVSLRLIHISMQTHKVSPRFRLKFLALALRLRKYNNFEVSVVCYEFLDLGD